MASLSHALGRVLAVAVGMLLMNESESFADDPRPPDSNQITAGLEATFTFHAPKPWGVAVYSEYQHVFGPSMFAPATSAGAYARSSWGGSAPWTLTAGGRLGLVWAAWAVGARHYDLFSTEGEAGVSVGRSWHPAFEGGIAARGLVFGSIRAFFVNGMDTPAPRGGLAFGLGVPLLYSGGIAD